MFGDAWHELSGYDGRFVRTFRRLLGQPGALTVDVLEGRRARYISPVRLYLMASVIYFICAASVPNIERPQPAALPGSKVKVAIDGSGRASDLSAEDRARALEDLERAPWVVQKVLRPVVTDADGFRSRFLHTLPRVLFALVPLFAAIVGLFHRRRRFAQHLVFALHLQTAIFIALTLRELSQLTWSRIVLGIFEVGSAVFIIVYGVRALRRVYRESWPRVLAKSVGITVLYVVAGITAILVTGVWTAVIQ